SGVAYGLVVLALSLTAFLAPPFTGLDTLPAMGVVVISAGILLDDSLLVLGGILVGAAGVALVVGLGGLVVEGIRELV
ncbi:MAG TPA: exopolysaccharide biosynthesis protein, partial [Solirubrobacterales bacterium]|nr:exopolysaccharide biosynthesis protein [Solirubrobacterales bacterium]